MPLSRFIHLALLPLAGAVGRGRRTQAPSALRNSIAPHRAVYDISLARTESGSGVSSAKGPHGFRGHRSAPATATRCASAWSSISATRRAISASSTFASPRSNRATATSTPSTSRTDAERGGGRSRSRARRGATAAAIEVSLKQPTEKKVELDSGVLFPSQHLQAIIDAALANRKVHLQPTSTRAPAPATRATRPPPRSATRMPVERRQPAPERRSPLADLGRLFRADQEGSRMGSARNCRAIR